MRWMLIASLLAGCGSMPVNGDGSVMGDAGVTSTVPMHCTAADGTVIPRDSVCDPGWMVACAYADDARFERSGDGTCTGRFIAAAPPVCIGGIPTPGTIDHTCPVGPGPVQWRCVPLLDGCPAPQ